MEEVILENLIDVYFSFQLINIVQYFKLYAEKQKFNSFDCAVCYNLRFFIFVF